MALFKGTLTALVTPFRGGKLDEKALRDLVEQQIAGGIDGLVPCGTTGESPALSLEEHARVIAVVVEQAKKRVPVVAGAGTASTDKTVVLAKQAKAAGADGLLLVCPYYNRPTQKGLAAHFRHVLKEVPLPTILYNIPKRSGIDLSVETLKSLSDVKEVVAIKEATGDVLRAQEVVSQCGDRFAVLSGDDALSLATFAVGGVGIVSVTSNLLPKEIGDVYRLWSQGKTVEARALHQRLLRVHNAMFVESNPGPIKAVMAARGLIAAEIRLPLLLPESQVVEQVLNTVTQFEAGK